MRLIAQDILGAIYDTIPERMHAIDFMGCMGMIVEGLLVNLDRADKKAIADSWLEHLCKQRGRR